MTCKMEFERVRLPETGNSPEAAYFDDPSGAAIVFTTIDLLKEEKREGKNLVRKNKLIYHYRTRKIWSL
jgi:hypothetical protein